MTEPHKLDLSLPSGWIDRIAMMQEWTRIHEMAAVREGMSYEAYMQWLDRKQRIAFGLRALGMTDMHIAHELESVPLDVLEQYIESERKV
jgi:hypothetical protein